MNDKEKDIYEQNAVCNTITLEPRYMRKDDSVDVDEWRYVLLTLGIEYEDIEEIDSIEIKVDTLKIYRT